MNEMSKKLIQKETREDNLHMMREPIPPHVLDPHGPGHRHPIPPHERRNMIYVEFDEDSVDAMREMFGSEEEAEIAISILHNAPPEQQVLALQHLRLNGVNVKASFQEIHHFPIRFPSPILGEEIYEEYEKIYGEDGLHYLEILETAPYEISVISRMIAYKQEKRGE